MTMNKLFACFFLSLKGVITQFSRNMFLSVFACLHSEARTLQGVLLMGAASLIRYV